MAAKASSAPKSETLSSSSSSNINPIEDPEQQQHVSLPLAYLRKRGIAQPIPRSCNTSGFYSHFFQSFINNINLIQRGRISCTIHVKPSISNIYEILHGGSVASLTELLSVACARTVIGENKELFLGEISMTYLSGAPTNAQVIADACVVKSGRNVTMVALEFKLNNTGNLIYIAHATFYHIPLANL